MFYQPKIDFKPEEVLEYLRKSQSDDPLLTIEEVLAKHEAMLNEWAEKNLGSKVPEENKFREVVSGETIKGRPEIGKILRLIESPKIKAVSVVEPQRLTRGDLEDIGYLMKLFKHTNTLVITPNRIYDLRDEYDWDAFERELKRGNDYLLYYKKIQARGKLASVAAGNYISSKPPYGYEKTTVMDGKRKCPTLRINEDEANAVRIIYDLYVNKNYGRQRIAAYLDEMGIKAPKGKHWSASGICDILSNIHYIGKIRWNWRKTVTVVEDGEFKKTRPHTSIDEQLIFDGKHEAIISEKLYYAAQEKQGKNPRVRKNLDLRNPFAGVVFCRNCGRRMTFQQGATDQPRFLCPNTKHCGTASCKYVDFCSNVHEALKKCIDDFEIRIKNDDKDSRALHAKLVKQLENKLVELEKKEISQWEKYSDEGMPKHIFDSLNEKVLAEKETVKQALCKAQESMPDPVDYEEQLINFKNAVEVLHNPDVPAEEKNRLLKLCIVRIEYHRERPVMKPKNQTGCGTFPATGVWTSPPIELDVTLKV